MHCEEKWVQHYYKHIDQLATMSLSEHKFVVSFCILGLLVGLHLPPEPVFSLILLLYFPGVLLASVMKKELNLVEGLFLPPLFGICFWIVFSYFVSELKILHWLTIMTISFVSSVLADRQNIRIRRNSTESRELIFLLVCYLFIVSYSYPWDQFFSWMPPGDDMKYHIPFIEDIGEAHSLPENYGELYPEVTTLTYPLGYHIITALAGFSGTSVASVIVTTILILPLACFSFYFLGKTLFNRKTGLYSAFSLSFLSLFFHRLLGTSTYPNLLGITLQIFALFLLVETFSKKSRSLLMVTALAFAAAGETHPYILLLNIIILSFLFGWFLLQRDSCAKSVVLIGVVFLLFCVPYFLRLEFESPSDIELRTYIVWYAQDSIRSFADLVKNVSALSPLVVFFGICGTFTLKDRNPTTILALWIAAILVIPILSVFQVQYPGWYTISPNRFLFFLFMPLSILCGRFFSNLEIILSRQKFLFFMAVVVLFSVGMHHGNLFHSFSPDPTNEVHMNPDDLFIMEWITDHTSKETVILNTGPTADCSSWVPVISNRRVIFPFFSGNRGDGCIRKLKAHEKKADLEILKYTPDSDLALQILKKYDIEYIYIPAWKKSAFLELYFESLLESPLYHLLVKKGDAYLFRVDYDEKPRNTFFVISKRETITLREEQWFELSFTPQLSADVEGSFFLHVEYPDDGYGHLDVGQDRKYIGSVLKYDTGEEKSMIFPLSEKEEIKVSFYPEFDFFLKEVSILFGIENAMKISENIGLKGTGWVKSENVTAAAEDAGLRIYLFDVAQGELIIRYADVGYGNVDINVADALGAWHRVKIIYRENTGSIKQVRIPIRGDYAVLALGVYVHGEHFTIASMDYRHAHTQWQCL